MLRICDGMAGEANDNDLTAAMIVALATVLTPRPSRRLLPPTARTRWRRSCRRTIGGHQSAGGERSDRAGLPDPAVG